MKGSFMQKIRIQISGLSPVNIRLLSDAVLQLARILEDEALFELCDVSSKVILLPSVRAVSASGTPISAPGSPLPTVRVPVDDLICITADRHYVLFTCIGSVLRVRLRFRDAAALVPSGQFLACGRGVLLNMAHIREISREEFVLSNGSVFSISRRKKRELTQTFLNYRSLHIAP